MNSIEVLEGKLAAVSWRVRLLEEAVESRAHLSKDDMDAQRVAIGMGFDPTIIFMGRKRSGDDEVGKKLAVDRWCLAKELRSRGWSATRIARVFGCSDRTVQRWFE